MKPKRETDLYPPVRDWLAAQGYVVRAEVRGCDITAVRGEDVVVVELKRSFSLDLVLQAVDRQTITDSVYLAVPEPPKGRQKGRWRRLIRLLRRLELGLITVDLDRRLPAVHIVCQPEPYARQKKGRVRRALLEEAALRTGDRNQGGSTRVKLVTAYREAALFIAWLLDRGGPASPKALRKRGAVDKAQPILYSNHYGWFKRMGVGLYGLTAKGRKALVEYDELVRLFQQAEEPEGPAGRD